MRQTIFFLCLFAYVSVFGQTAQTIRANLSFDMASVIAGRCLRLGFSHSLDGKWSAGGSVSIPLNEADRVSEEESGHYSMFGDEEKVSAKPQPEFRMGMRFWPRGFFDGFYLGLSCFHGLSSGTDIEIGCGYAVRIWRGLGMSAGYEQKLADSSFGAEGFSININYCF